MLAEIEVPNSVVGPPTNVAISPKEDIALVTSAMRIDPADPTKQIPDDKADRHRSGAAEAEPRQPHPLGRRCRRQGRGAAPKIIATLQAGKGAAGVSINKAGTLALVANRAEGTVSVFTISGTTVTPAGKVTVGKPDSRPSHVVFAPDGKRALVTRDGDHRIAVLSIDGNKVEATKREIAAGLRPYGIDIAAKGEVAVVANIGIGSGDADTISVIDLKLEPPRVVNTYTVGQTPEGIKMSPDGKFVAVTVMNGSNKPPSSPFYNDNGLLQVWARNGTQLDQDGRAADRQLVPGHRLGHQQQDAAGAVHGRGGDQRGPLLRPDGKIAAEGRHHQDQGRPAGIRTVGALMRAAPRARAERRDEGVDEQHLHSARRAHGAAGRRCLSRRRSRWRAATICAFAAAELIERDGARRPPPARSRPPSCMAAAGARDAALLERLRAAARRHRRPRARPAAHHGHRQRHARQLLRRRALPRRTDAAIAHALQLEAEGADILDIGGEFDAARLRAASTSRRNAAASCPSSRRSPGAPRVRSRSIRARPR